MTRFISKMVSRGDHRVITIWIKGAVAVSIIFVLVLIVRMWGGHVIGRDLNEIQSDVHSYGVWAPVVFILLYQVRAFVLFPHSVAAVAAGLIWGWTGLVYILLAVCVCASWQFFAARYFAREAVEKAFRGKAQKIRALVDRNGFKSVVLIRLFPNIMLDVQNLAFGLTNIGYGRYIVGTVIGLLPGLIVLIYFADVFVQGLSNPRYGWKLLLLAGLLLVGYWFLKKLIDRQLRDA